jgi:hypothetical protein
VYEPRFPPVTCANESSATTPWPRIPKELAIGEAHQQHPNEDERDLTEASGMPIEAKRAPNDAQAESDDHYRETDADKMYHYVNSSEKTGPRPRTRASADEGALRKRSHANDSGRRCGAR